MANDDGCDFCGLPKATAADGEMSVNDPRVATLCWANGDHGEMCQAEKSQREAAAALRQGRQHKERS